jgi:hypothetical protein
MEVVVEEETGIGIGLLLEAMVAVEKEHQVMVETMITYINHQTQEAQTPEVVVVV